MNKIMLAAAAAAIGIFAGIGAEAIAAQGDVTVTAPNALPEAGAPGAEKVKVELYGFAQMDAIYDFNRVNPAWNATLRPSRIPVVCPGDPGCGNDGEAILSVRQSRLGVKALVPTSQGALTTRFEFDLFGVGVDEGQTTFRLRHAYGELGHFLAGQTNSLFMDGDVFPNTIDYWGPNGMIFFRNVQARWTPINANGRKFAVAIEDPGAGLDTSSAGMGAMSSHDPFPDVTAQYRMDHSWGHVQVAGILRRLGFETPAGASGDPSGTKNGYGVNVSGSYKLRDKNKLMAQVAYGEGISAYINDCCSDLGSDAAGNVETLPLLGWLLYYDHYWNARWSSSVGWSETLQNNSAGQLATAFHKGQYASANLLHYPAKNVLTGVELLYGTRENKDGASNSDTRVQFSAKFDF
jgi:hypothetical protein